jgi:hypothetical protein
LGNQQLALGTGVLSVHNNNYKLSGTLLAAHRDRAMKKAVLLIVAVAVGLHCTSLPALAKKPRREELVDQVRNAIKRGIKYLRGAQKSDGSWEIDDFSVTRRGGWTALAMLALLNAGVSPDDKMIQKGLTYLRQLDPTYTYVRALQTMVYAEAGMNEDSERIQSNVNWLIDAGIADGKTLLGWTYTKARQAPDNSNTQYALLGLHAGKMAGAKIPRAVWVMIRDYYIRTQTTEIVGGGWVYSRHHNNLSYLTMDTAGLCGLLIAGEVLNAGREKLKINEAGSYYADNCGKYKEDPSIRKALSWITYTDPDGKTRFNLQMPNRIYYNLYGIERAGRLSGQRFLGVHDWYREGCEFLVGEQDKVKGCWPGKGQQFDKWPLINTSFALLFLSKGRTPVLISKMVHGPGDDWNNDRNDIKNLVQYASKTLFKRQHLAWQSFDARRGILGRPRTEGAQDKIDYVAGELLQSPIAYFNGHKEPEFSPAEINVLKQFLDNGGFILAEACCGRKAFNTGIEKVVRQLFPDDPDIKLEDLEPGHPIWTSFFKIKPGSFKLKAIKSGCKTVLVYSPQDLSCLWEANKFDSGKRQLAFRLGANIIAYATGLQMPDDKLSRKEILKNLDASESVPRNYLKIAQLMHGGDWQPAPRAMRILLSHMENEVGLNVDKVRKKIAITSDELTNYKFLYMHGNKPFSFKREDLKKLRFNLESGGLLFADACCGSKQFDKSFRVFVKELFPERRLEAIPVEKEELYSARLNDEDEPISDKIIRCRTRRPDGKGAAAEFRNMAPALEGIKIDGRWVIIYSKYDIGCALERHQSSDCVGYDHESALRLGKAAILYALKR